MNTALAPDPDLGLFELRVLEGEQRGASAPLPLAQPFEIGGPQAECDVQLRDRQIGQARVRVTLQGAVGARLEVLAGAALLNGRPLAAGDQADWPLYAPLRLGATLLALGEPDSAQWQLPLIAAEAPAPAAQATAPSPAAAAAAEALPGRRRIERWLAGAGAVLALLTCTAWLVLQTPSPRVAPAADLQPRTLRLLMAAPEFQALRVEPGPQGPVVRGHLQTTQQRERLQRLLAEAGLGAVQLEVWSGEQLAAAVADVFRVQRITARAEGDAAGQVTVHTQEPDGARLDRAMATARRDVAGLVGLTLKNQPPAPPPEHVPVADDPGKRIASIVPGESPYVVTADGTRYFLGALLPTGHRIDAIDAHSVLLFKDGQHHTLRF
ncbi:MAG: hypothetical protein AB1430_07610 [Pseudomonadota bacterium]